MPRPRAIRAVLFDLGGTLLDERDFVGWAELARRLYLELDLDAFAHFYGEVERELDAEAGGLEREEWRTEFWRRVLARTVGRPLDAARAARFVALLREAPPAVRVFSDVRRCLDLLRADGRRLAVVSNSTSEAGVRRLLDRAGLLDYFERVVSSGTEGVAKPDPEIFRRAVARMGLAPAEALMVGNLPTTDARGAAAAGLHAVWLHRDGFGLGEDPPEITSLLEVPLVLGRLEAARPSGPPRL